MPNPILRDPLSGCRVSRGRRCGATPLLFVLVAGGFSAPRAGAQTPGLSLPVPVAGSRGARTPAIQTPAPAAVERPANPARAVNVLIVAFDDAPDTFSPAASVNNAPFTAPLTGVTPTRFDGAPAVWSALAKKKPKPDHRFDVVPEQPSKAPIFSGGANNTSPGANFDPGGSVPPTVVVPLPVRPVSPPGRAMFAALSLARALNALGYTDVQTTSSDGALLWPVLDNKRLDAGTPQSLRLALKDLQNATRLPDALRQTSLDVASRRANDAACAIGQAMGFRAVVALYVSPLQDGTSPYTVMLSDTTRESGEPILWNEPARDEATARNTGAATGAALIDRSLGGWPPGGPSMFKTLAEAHLAKARAAGAAGDLAKAQAETTRATALDPTRADAFVLLGDLFAPTDLNRAAFAYKQALALNGKDGATLEKVAIAYVNAPLPDYPRALDAGRRALALGTDTANLRVALARAQFGRADLFRAQPSGLLLYKADDAEADAQIHLDRALQLSPDNPDALRLLARTLITTGRTSEAVETLDRVLPLFPQDISLLRQYAQALVTLGNRKEDAFVAYAKLWKLTANSAPSVDALSYVSLTQGFDEHVFSLGKSARQLSEGVAAGAVAREAAFLQLARLKADMADAESAISTLRVPGTFSKAASATRQFAANLMNQALEEHQKFLDTGQDVYRNRAAELYRQAVAQLNAARDSN